MCIRDRVTEEYEILFSEDHDYIEALSDNDALRHAMREIKEKERYVVLARILDEKGFDEIADELSLIHISTALQIDGETIPQVSSYCVHSGKQIFSIIPGIAKDEDQMIAVMER